MAWAPARPDPAAIIGNLDTTETAGPSARMGHIEQISPVFAVAEAVDASRRGLEGRAGENLAQQALGTLGQQMLAEQQAEEGRRRAAIAASPQAQEALARQGLRINPATGQVERTGPPQTGSGTGLGQMVDVQEQL